jgi:hypothetical protein
MLQRWFWPTSTPLVLSDLLVSLPSNSLLYPFKSSSTAAVPLGAHLVSSMAVPGELACELCASPFANLCSPAGPHRWTLVALW